MWKILTDEQTTGIKQKTPHNNTLSRKPLKFSELVFDLILDLRDVLI